MNLDCEPTFTAGLTQDEEAHCTSRNLGHLVHFILLATSAFQLLMQHTVQGLCTSIHGCMHTCAVSSMSVSSFGKLLTLVDQVGLVNLQTLAPLLEKREVTLSHIMTSLLTLREMMWSSSSSQASKKSPMQCSRAFKSSTKIDGSYYYPS